MDERQEQRLEEQLARQNRQLALLQTIFTILGVVVGIIVTVGQPLYNLSVNQKLADARISVLEAKVADSEKSKNEIAKSVSEVLIRVVRIEGKLDAKR